MPAEAVEPTVEPAVEGLEAAHRETNPKRRPNVPNRRKPPQHLFNHRRLRTLASVMVPMLGIQIRLKAGSSGAAASHTIIQATSQGRVLT